MGTVVQEDLEFAAWRDSAYSYSDAEKLGWFWQVETYDAKLRIGRKIKWANHKILDQMLYEATGQYNWIVKGPYSYQDAEALAAYWGSTVTQAKITGGHKLAGWLVLNEAINNAHGKGARIAFYTVAPGDTLTSIAYLFSTPEMIITVDALVDANRDTVVEPDLIFVGQILRIPLLND